MKHSTPPLVKLPQDEQFILFLIKQELKSRKLFQAFNSIGLSDCSYQPHLDEIILTIIGLTDISDETFSSYTTIMDKRSEKIEDNDQSITKQALKAYHELLSLKRLSNDFRKQML